MKLIGVDPGEVHCGYARLDINLTRGSYIASAAVFDVPMHEWTPLVIRLIPEPSGERQHDQFTILVEEYRQRPLGHQAFKAARTPRMIGAIEYAAMRARYAYAEVPAGDPDKELPNLVLGKYLKRWAREWPERGHRDWQHARAAWRVIARHMLVEYPQQLINLNNSASLDSLVYHHVDGLLIGEKIAPQAFWQSAI